MKRTILIEMSGKITIRKEGKKTIEAPTRAEIRKNLEKGAELRLLFTPLVNGKRRTTKQFFDWYKKEMKTREVEDRKEKMRSDFRFADTAKKISSYGFKKEEVKELLNGLEVLHDNVGWDLDDMGVLKELPYENIKKFATRAVAEWLSANFWELRGGVGRFFSREYRSYHSLEEAIEIAKRDRVDAVHLKQRLQSSLEKRKEGKETREERIGDFLLRHGVIGLEHGEPRIIKRELWEKCSKELGLKEEKRVELSRTLGAYRGKEFSLLDSLEFELSREDQAAHGLGKFDCHLAGGAVTIKGYKRVDHVFLRDAWTEYNENGELFSLYEKNQENWFEGCRVDTVAEAEYIGLAVLRLGQISNWHHFEVVASGKFEVTEVTLDFGSYISSEEDEFFAAKDSLEFTKYLEGRGIKVTNWTRCPEIVFDAAKALIEYEKEEKEIGWYESLVPANSKVALWD